MTTTTDTQAALLAAKAKANRKRHIRELRGSIESGMDGLERWFHDYELGPPTIYKSHPRDWGRPGSGWHWDKVQSYADAGCADSAAALVKFRRSAEEFAEFAATAPEDHPQQTEAEYRAAMREIMASIDAKQAERETNPKPLNLPSVESVAAAYRRERGLR
ncbi:MAG: hypothetical protein EOP38_17115 [Rubrivivax sp.]|nr:MAG: hypothetical protein EOP38_17115 [Rubrivivax sp.]